MPQALEEARLNGTGREEALTGGGLTVHELARVRSQHLPDCVVQAGRP